MNTLTVAREPVKNPTDTAQNASGGDDHDCRSKVEFSSVHIVLPHASMTWGVG